MYFPVANVEVSPFVPVMVAFTISFFTSMAGVSGAFLLLPFQMSYLGFTSPAVSATNQLFNIVAIPSGVYRYLQEGRMVWPLTWVVIIGTLPGVLVGAVIRIRYLPDPATFKVFAGLVLLYIGLKLIRDIWARKKGDSEPTVEQQFQEMVKGSKQQGSEHLSLKVEVVEFNFARISYDFCDQNFSANTLAIFSLSAVVGVIGGVYGIGGGAIIAPFFISFFGLPIYTVAGAALMGTFVTSGAGVILYQLIAPYYPDMAIAPDWSLGLLLGLGGACGMYLGARMQKYMPAQLIKWLLATTILFTAGKYIFY